MNEEITVIYCVCKDLLDAIGHRNDPQCKVTDAEVCMLAIVAARLFGGNFEKTRIFLHEHGYMFNTISKSRMNKRIHHLAPILIEMLAQVWKTENKDGVYLIDSFPIPVCQNIRISRCNIYNNEEFRGYNASKRIYFYGLKVHLITTIDGKPVEILLTPGNFSDTNILSLFNFGLPKGSIIYGDKAYNWYEIEDLLAEYDGIKLQPIRKKNSKRKFDACTEFLQKVCRKTIETTNSLITKMFPKTIHAVTAAGFELKAFLFVMAHSFEFAAQY
ncbi:transposase [Gammaproteobacteria bacterium]